MAFTRTELLGYQNAEVPDLLGPGLRLLFVGINPGLWSAATGTHFARPGNRFYPALAAAGITDRLIRVDREELQEGALRLADKVAVLGPRVVAVAGITAYRVGF